MAVVALPQSGRSGINPFYVMEVMRAAEEREAAGGEVLHLEVGQPSTSAPAGVIRAARAALESDVLGYTTAAGLEPLRARLSDHYRSWYGAEVDPSRVVVTLGASGAFVLAFLAAFDAGDRVVVPTPGYPCYRNALQALNAEVVTLPTFAETRFQPSPELLDDLCRRTGSVDGLVLASPSNPSGTMLDGPALAAVSDWCAAHGVRLVADEIYHGITFGAPAPTALNLNSDALVVNSFSKYFSMTGWRLGWVIAPGDLVEPIRRLAQNFFIAAPTLSQIAAVAAFDCHDELQANVARYAVNRSVLLDGPPGGRHRPPGPQRRRLLRVRGRRPPRPRQPGAVPALARRARGGGHARRRLRPGRGPPLRPVLLRGRHRRHGRGHGTPQGVGRIDKKADTRNDSGRDDAVSAGAPARA